jgi:hypothetical protein
MNRASVRNQTNKVREELDEKIVIHGEQLHIILGALQCISAQLKLLNCKMDLMENNNESS